MYACGGHVILKYIYGILPTLLIMVMHTVADNLIQSLILNLIELYFFFFRRSRIKLGFKTYR